MKEAEAQSEKMKAVNLKSIDKLGKAYEARIQEMQKDTYQTCTKAHEIMEIVKNVAKQRDDCQCEVDKLHEQKVKLMDELERLSKSNDDLEKKLAESNKICGVCDKIESMDTVFEPLDSIPRFARRAQDTDNVTIFIFNKVSK